MALHFIRPGKIPLAALPVAGVDEITGELDLLKTDGAGKLLAAISASISGADGAITDGVTASIRATVIESVSNPGTYGLVILDSGGNDIAGSSGGGGAVTIANGADTNAGATTDAKVTGDNTGTLAAKIRGLNYLLALATDTANSRINVYLQNTSIAAVPTPATSGGCSNYHLVAGASTNAGSIKASAGQVYGVHVFNNAAYPVYVKLHNTAGTPTVGAGVVYTVAVQAGQRADVVLPMGMAFSTGIGITIVKDIADAGTTAVASADCVVDIDYK